MRSNKHEAIRKNFQELLGFKNREDQWGHDAQMLMFQFMGLVDEKMKEEGISKKELANKINTSTAYLTQLFKGDKKLNFKTLAKLQDVLNIRFEITTHEKEARKWHGYNESLRELKDLISSLASENTYDQQGFSNLKLHDYQEQEFAA
jgi:ribosome-binding protein aMBF1 (putative translation factor)